MNEIIDDDIGHIGSGNIIGNNNINNYNNINV